jgi:hypothetical protein
MNTSNTIQQVNSNSYADLLGLYVGLPRFLGESNNVYLQRLYEFSGYSEDITLVGVLDQINIALGLQLTQSISITSTDTYFTIMYSPGLFTLVNQAGTVYTYQTVTMAPDTYWVWNTYSDLVAFINTIENYTAALIGSDGSCRCLVKQTNSFTALNEPVTSSVYTFQNPNALVNTLVFNVAVPSYTVTNNIITFSANVPSNLTVSYQYQIVPYDMVSGEANILSLTDPTLATVGLNASNYPAYQLLEAIQEIMSQDLSYWGN